MRISEKGLSLIKEFEGCELTSYKCPSGVWTIGWGHTENVNPNQSITQEEAENLLINDMVKYENYVNTCSNLTFVTNQNQFDALVSFTYNCGQGSLATLVQNRDTSTVADKLLLYINGSNGVLQGLVRRREAERVLFLDGNYVEVAPIEEVVEQYSTPQSNTSNNVLLIQQLCNFYGANIIEDGIYGSQTEGAIRNYLPLAGIQYKTPRATLIIQIILNIQEDGIFLYGTKSSVENFQSNQGNLTCDGVVGFETYKALARS